MDNLYIIALLTVAGSFALVTVLIPKISWIVRSRNLIDQPDQRSSHNTSTPTMAGVSFFLTILFVVNIFQAWDNEVIAINLIAAIGLMFAVGLKDDLVVTAPRAKIGGEILAIFFILFCNCLEVSTLNGFLGIHEIPVLLSYVIIVLMILTIINSYNMIDGIDGLASVIGIAIFCVYGTLFFIAELHFYFLICLCLIGILIGYLRYNLSATRKIFMGDTGSLIIGFCIGFLSLKFLSTDASLLNEYAFKAENKLIVIGAILFVPLFDTLRVIGVRLLNKKSPFYPDNNHIHHILIDSGLSHFKASLFLCFLSLAIAISLITLSTYFSSYQMIGFMSLYFGFFLALFNKLKTNIGKKNRFRHLISAIQFLF